MPFARRVSQVLSDQTDIEPTLRSLPLRMPILDGVQVVEQIRREFPDAVLVVLTTFDSDDDIDRSLVAGAKGYLLKDYRPRIWWLACGRYNVVARGFRPRLPRTHRTLRAAAMSTWREAITAA
jgi:DNA-binding NarL/FixJ family response regulator